MGSLKNCAIMSISCRRNDRKMGGKIIWNNL